MGNRGKNIVVRVDDEEQAMARAVSKASDDPISRILRRYIRTLYRERFGDASPPRPKTKTH